MHSWKLTPPAGICLLFLYNVHVTTNRVLKYSYTKHFINSKVQQFITNL